jgi:hypothetical protein
VLGSIGEEPQISTVKIFSVILYCIISGQLQLCHPSGSNLCLPWRSSIGSIGEESKIYSEDSESVSGEKDATFVTDKYPDSSSGINLR